MCVERNENQVRKSDISFREQRPHVPVYRFGSFGQREKSACLCAQQIRFHHHHHHQRLLLLLLLVCPNFHLSFPNLLAVVAPFSKRRRKKKREMRTWVFAGFASLSIVAELWPGYCDVRVTHGVKRDVNERPASAHGSCRRPYTHSHPEECDSVYL